MALLLRVEHEEDEVKARKQRVRQLNIVDDRLVPVPLRLDRIRRRQNRRARVQLADDACADIHNIVLRCI